MKKYIAILELMLLFFLSSCLTQKPIMANETPIVRDVKTVTPQWKYETGPAYYSSLYGLMAGSFAIGCLAGPSTFNGVETKEDKQEAALLGGLVAFAGAYLIIDTFLPKKKIKEKKENPVTVESSDIYRWLNKYNKQNAEDYVVFEELEPEVKLMSSNTMYQAQSYQRECFQAVERLKNTEVSWDGLSKYHSLMNHEFAVLFPSEIDNLKGAFKEEERSAAFSELKQLQKTEIDKDASDPTLKSIDSFKSANSHLWSKIDHDQRKEITDDFSDKILSVLNVLVKPYSDKISSESFLGLHIQEINQIRKDFSYSYDKYDSYEPVSDFYNLYSTRKSEVISRLHTSLSLKIQEHSSIDQIEKIPLIYLSHTAPTPQVMDIQNKVESRIALIREYQAEQKRKAEEERILAELRAREVLGEFHFESLSNSRLIGQFFEGNFSEIPFKRDDMFFSSMINEFMYSMGRNCYSGQGENQVQIYESVCKTESVTRNGWGIETSRYCVEWVSVPTGLYVSSELHAANKKIQSIGSKQVLSNAFQLLGQMATGGGWQALTNEASRQKDIQSDMKKLVASNDCNGKAILRFEQNLIRFASGESAIRLVD